MSGAMIAAMLQGANTPCTLLAVVTQDRMQGSHGLWLIMYQQSAMGWLLVMTDSIFIWLQKPVGAPRHPWLPHTANRMPASSALFLLLCIDLPPLDVRLTTVVTLRRPGSHHRHRVLLLAVLRRAGGHADAGRQLREGDRGRRAADAGPAHDRGAGGGGHAGAGRALQDARCRGGRV